MRHNAYNSLLLGICLLGGLLSAVAWADIVTRDAPITIEADSAEIQDNLSTYSGNVNVVQGGVSLNGSHMIVRRGRGNSFTFTLTGRPAEIRQRGEPDIRGNAERIDYASGTGTLELRGNAVIFRGNEKIAGGDIRYSFRDRRTIVNNRGRGSSGRVQITLQPGDPEEDNNGGDVE